MSHGDCCDNCIPVAAVCELNDGGTCTIIFCHKPVFHLIPATHILCRYCILTNALALIAVLGLPAQLLLFGNPHVLHVDNVSWDVYKFHKNINTKEKSPSPITEHCAALFLL